MRPSPVLFAAAVLGAATVFVKKRSDRRGKKPPERQSVLPVAIVQHSIPKILVSEASPEELDGSPKSCPDQHVVGEVEKVLGVGQRGGSKILEKDDEAEESKCIAVVGPVSEAEEKEKVPYKEARCDRATGRNGAASLEREIPPHSAMVEQEEAQEEEEEDPWAGEG